MNKIRSNHLGDHSEINVGSLDPIFCKRDDLEDNLRINTTPNKQKSLLSPGTSATVATSPSPFLAPNSPDFQPQSPDLQKPSSLSNSMPGKSTTISEAAEQNQRPIFFIEALNSVKLSKLDLGPSDEERNQFKNKVYSNDKFSIDDAIVLTGGSWGLF